MPSSGSIRPSAGSNVLAWLSSRYVCFCLGSIFAHHGLLQPRSISISLVSIHACIPPAPEHLQLFV